MLALYNFSIITRIFLSYDNPHAPINQVLRTKILRRSFYLAKSLDMIRDLHTTVCNDQKINQDTCPVILPFPTDMVQELPARKWFDESHTCLDFSPFHSLKIGLSMNPKHCPSPR